MSPGVQRAGRVEPGVRRVTGRRVPGRRRAGVRIVSSTSIPDPLPVVLTRVGPPGASTPHSGRDAPRTAKVARPFSVPTGRPASGPGRSGHAEDRGYPPRRSGTVAGCRCRPHRRYGDPEGSGGVDDHGRRTVSHTARADRLEPALLAGRQGRDTGLPSLPALRLLPAPADPRVPGDRSKNIAPEAVSGRATVPASPSTTTSGSPASTLPTSSAWCRSSSSPSVRLTTNIVHCAPEDGPSSAWRSRWSSSTARTPTGTSGSRCSSR